MAIWPNGSPGAKEGNVNKRESLMQRLRKLLGEAPGMELLNPNLLFGSAWFWTLPEVQEAQREIDARNANFRRYLGIDKGFGEIAKEADAQTPLSRTMGH
jgi:hypothetical protein